MQVTYWRAMFCIMTGLWLWALLQRDALVDDAKNDTCCPCPVEYR